MINRRALEDSDLRMDSDFLLASPHYNIIATQSISREISLTFSHCKLWHLHIIHIRKARFTYQKYSFCVVWMCPCTDAWNVPYSVGRSACSCTRLYSMHISTDARPLELFPAVGEMRRPQTPQHTDAHSHFGSQYTGELFCYPRVLPGEGERQRDSERKRER